MEDLFEVFDRDCPDFEGAHKIKNFEDFWVWWNDLDKESRERLDSDYKKGYEKCIEEARETVALLTQAHLRI